MGKKEIQSNRDNYGNSKKTYHTRVTKVTAHLLKDKHAEGPRLAQVLQCCLIQAWEGCNKFRFDCQHLHALTCGCLHREPSHGFSCSLLDEKDFSPCICKLVLGLRLRPLHIGSISRVHSLSFLTPLSLTDASSSGLELLEAQMQEMQECFVNLKPRWINVKWISE